VPLQEVPNDVIFSRISLSRSVPSHIRIIAYILYTIIVFFTIFPTLNKIFTVLIPYQTQKVFLTEFTLFIAVFFLTLSPRDHISPTIFFQIALPKTALSSIFHVFLCPLYLFLQLLHPCTPKSAFSLFSLTVPRQSISGYALFEFCFQCMTSTVSFSQFLIY
jgi:hypothetical protein